MKNLLNFAHPFFSIEKLIQITSQNIILPFYHNVSDVSLPHIKHLYPVRNTASFIDDLDFFCTHYTPISIDTLYKIVSENKRIDKPVFHLTFDDGLKEFYFIIAPILEERKIPATIFLNTNFIDNKELFYRYKVSLLIDKIKTANNHSHLRSIKSIINLKGSNWERKLLSLKYKDQTVIGKISDILSVNFNEFLRISKPYLSTNEIEDLMIRGFTFGSHSTDHPFFNEINAEEKRRQVRDSFALLEEKFNIKNKYFSFPFSDEGITVDFFDWLFNTQNCKLSFGTSGLKKDYSKSILHRISIDGDTQPAEKIIKTEYLYFMVKKMFNKNFIKRV